MSPVKDQLGASIAFIKYLLFSVLHLQVLKVEIGLVLGSCLVSTMAVGNDRVEEILENFVGLLITSNAADGHDEGVTWRKVLSHQYIDRRKHVVLPEQIQV